MSQGNTNPSCWMFGTLEAGVGLEKATAVQEGHCQSPAWFPPAVPLLGRNRGFGICYDVDDPVVVRGGILPAPVGAHVGAVGPCVTKTAPMWLEWVITDFLELFCFK